MLPKFKLEEFWKKYEFITPHLLCASDAESWQLDELIGLADDESRRLWNTLRLDYTESPGLPVLREEIATLYTGLTKENIVTFAGAEEGIYCAMRTLISPGDHVIIITPCYESLGVLPKVLGAEVTSIVLKEEHGWKLSLSELQVAFRSDTKLLVLNYPHNPTGTLLRPEVFHGMIDLARQCGAFIFTDEVYRYLEIDETARLPSIADSYERGITLNVMTKAFGLAGLRIGWLASKDLTFLEEVGSYKLYTSICNSATSEILALIALRSKEKILARNRQIMMENIDLLDKFFERQSLRVVWERPESGSVALCRLLLPVAIEKFMEELVKAAGVLIMPGSVFELSGNFFRIGFGRKSMHEALRRFEQFLENYENYH